MTSDSFVGRLGGTGNNARRARRSRWPGASRRSSKLRVRYSHRPVVPWHRRDTRLTQFRGFVAL